MLNLNEHNITQAVLEQIANTPDPRLKRIMTSLIEHLHAFARDVGLTEEEWLKGIQFLTATGRKCDDVRQEFILLSDTLGLSQLVVAQSHSRPAGTTEQTVFGPFHVPGAPKLSHGADIANGAKGEPCYVSARVVADGTPVTGATVNVWHADAEGFYDVQDPKWTPEDMKLRAIFETDTDGRLNFWTVMPKAYPIPTDGPVGGMLEATKRHPMRPAHIHFMIAKTGYDSLITHVYVDGDKWLDSDAVFGVRSSCLGNYVCCQPGRAPDGRTLEKPFYVLNHEFSLSVV